MIVKATLNDLHLLQEYLLRDRPMNMMFLHELERFGFDSGSQEIWLMRQEGRRICGAIKRLFQHVSVYAQETAGTLEELGMFLAFLGPKSISGPLDILMRLELICEDYRLNPVMIMRLANPDMLIPGDSPPSPEIASASDAEDLACIIQSVTEFAQFYHGAAEIAMGMRSRILSGQTRHMMMRVDGKPVSQANTTSEMPDAAVIGGIATLPAYRGLGYASQVISRLCMDLLSEGKTPYLFFENEKAGALYRRLGFVETGHYGMLTRSD